MNRVPAISVRPPSVAGLLRVRRPLLLAALALGLHAAALSLLAGLPTTPSAAAAAAANGGGRAPAPSGALRVALLTPPVPAAGSNATARPAVVAPAPALLPPAVSSPVVVSAAPTSPASAPEVSAPDASTPTAAWVTVPAQAVSPVALSADELSGLGSPRAGPDVAHAAEDLLAEADPSLGEAPSPALSELAAADATGADEATLLPGASESAAAAGPATAAAEPASTASENRHLFKVYYGTVSRKVPVAKLEYSVRQDGDRYEIRTVAKADGLAAFVYSGVLTQTSSGRIGPEGLEPHEYVEQRGNRPQRVVSFDHDLGQLTAADRRSTVALPQGTQDRLSVIYQLGLLARATPERFAPGSVHAVPVASLKRISSEYFSVVGEETLQSADGPVRALHLSRPSPTGSDDPRIDVWLGYDLDMLPVRVRFEDSGGRVLDQVIDRAG
jgi:hypothetical protein